MPVPANYRWLFDDGTNQYRVPINPNRMSSPFPTKSLEVLTNVRGRHRTLRRSSLTPHEWTFSGVIRDIDHHDALVTWSQKQIPFTITDHLGRVFNVVPVRFNATEKRPSARITDKFDYEFAVLVLGWTL